MRSIRKCAPIAMVAAGALALAACGGSGGGGSSSNGSHVTMTWWTNATSGRPQVRVGAGGHRVPQDPPECDDPGRPDPERGVHHEGPGRPGVEQPAGHLPAVGRRPGGQPDPVGQGHQPQPVRVQLDRPGRVGGDGLAGRRQAVRRPLRPAHGRLLVPQGPVRQGRHHQPADHPGRAERRRDQAQGQGDRADRGGQQGPVAGRVLVGVLRGPPVLAVHPQGGDEGGQPVRSVLHAGQQRAQDVHEDATRSRPASWAPRPRSARAARPAWWPTARPPWNCRATGTPA